MRLLFISFLVFLSALRVFCQSDFSIVKNTTDFEVNLKSNISKMSSFESDFVQVKYVKYLDMEVVSKGKYYLKKPGKLKWVYTEPYDYSVVVNDGEVKVDDGGKSKEFKMKGSKIFNKVSRILELSMVGGFSSSEDFNFQLYEKEGAFKVVLEPKEGEKEIFSRFELFFGKKWYRLKSIRLVEVNGDYTDIAFENVKINEHIPNSYFSL